MSRPTIRFTGLHSFSPFITSRDHPGEQPHRLEAQSEKMDKVHVLNHCVVVLFVFLLKHNNNNKWQNSSQYGGTERQEGC